MRIFVEKEALNYELAKEITNRFEYEVIKSYESFDWGLKPYPELVSQGKNLVFLMKFKGKFFRKCPGTKNYFCCGYKIFHFAEGCPLDCSYCILQCYFNRPGIKLWANIFEEGFKELKEVLQKTKEEERVLRIGTGEFADSMALENICRVSERLVYFWKEIDPFAVLELKTKVYINEDYFKSLPSDPRIIFAWSVNPKEISDKEEHRTAPIFKRLESAELALKYGFTVAFHFDPIIYYPQAEEDYPALLELILKKFPHEKIAWISLGTLRYPPELKEIAEKRFPNTKIYSYEFIKGLDGKKRYFIELRNKLYKSLAKVIKNRGKDVTFYFCMEKERSWHEVLEKDVNSSEDVARLLDKVAENLCFYGITNVHLTQ